MLNVFLSVIVAPAVCVSLHSSNEMNVLSCNEKKKRERNQRDLFRMKMAAILGLLSFIIISEMDDIFLFERPYDRPDKCHLILSYTWY